MGTPTNTSLTGHSREVYWNENQRARLQANDDNGDPQDCVLDDAERLKVNAYISEVGPLVQELSETNALLRKLIVMVAGALHMQIPDDPGTL